jgi:hypothetical protein
MNGKYLLMIRDGMINRREVVVARTIEKIIEYNSLERTVA